MTQLSRRRILQSVGCALSGSLATWPNLVSSRKAVAAEATGSTADTLIPGKDARLIVHKAEPCEIETPLELLAEHRVTPKSALFVRNNQQIPGYQTLKPPTAGDWQIEFDGLVEFPRTLPLEELQRMPTVEREMVLQCSGNGRKFFSQASPCNGAQWEIGAAANVRFTGVPLAAVIEKLKLNVDERAQFIAAEGRDAPPKPDAADFEHSLPLADVRERSLLALSLNGEPLPAVHGGPVRLVTPGYYGTMHVKWLTRIRFESAETANHHQVRRYRTPHEPIRPGSEFEYDLSNSEPNWRMRIKSVVFAPADGAKVAAGKVEVRGMAFNDGGCAIDRVEISTDGDTWRRAELDVPDSPFAWYLWRQTIDLSPGAHVLRCRAIDALGRTQPLDGAIHWNPAGYGWNGVHAIRITAA